MNQPIVQEPTVDYFKASTGVTLPSLGSLFQSSPIMIASKKFQANKRGVGADADCTGEPLSPITSIAVLLVGGVLFYQAGKAMAPTKGQETSWGWSGAVVGLISPWALGLGIMGAISNSKK